MCRNAALGMKMSEQSQSCARAYLAIGRQGNSACQVVLVDETHVGQPHAGACVAAGSRGVAASWGSPIDTLHVRVHPGPQPAAAAAAAAARIPAAAAAGRVGVHAQAARVAGGRLPAVPQRRLRIHPPHGTNQPYAGPILWLLSQ